MGNTTYFAKNYLGIGKLKLFFIKSIRERKKLMPKKVNLS